MAINVNDISFGYPGSETLFWDVSFKVDTGQTAGLVGDNAVGKSTMLRMLAGELESESGSIVIDGRARRMAQSIGLRGSGVSVRELLADLSGLLVKDADRDLAEAYEQNKASASAGAATRLAAAIAAWGDIGGWELEARWDRHTMSVLRQPLAEAASRPVAELSGGERKRLALEILLASDADVLLLDEPDNFLDVPAKRWLEQQLLRSPKTVLVVSHDRELLSNAVDRIVTVEGSGTWVHGGSFADYHDARDARNERLGSALERWQQEERRLYRYYKLLKQRAAISDGMAARADAAQSRWERFVDAGPPPAPPSRRRVNMQLHGADSGRRVVRCADLEIAGLTDPFSVDVYFGDRVAVIGPNGSGKSHFVRLLNGEPMDSAGTYSIGARVTPGLFFQTNERPEFANRTPLDVLGRMTGTEEKTMRALARYGLHGVAGQPFESLSGGQQARLQVLALELGGANLLLLDEPTDNLDLVSAEALQEAIAGFTGTIVAVSHDRWFLRSFSRFLVFELDGSVREAMDIETALGMISGDEFEPRPGFLKDLGAEAR